MTDMYPITDTLSEALSYDEEIRLLRSWRKDSDHKSRETLIKNYILFAVKKVGSFYPHIAQDGIMEIAHRALLMAIDKFNADREQVGRLSNLIPLYAKGEYRRYIRNRQPVNCPVKKDLELPMFVSLDAPLRIRGNHMRDVSRHDVGVETCTSPEIDLDSLLGEQASALDEKLRAEIKQVIAEAMSTLPKNQRRIIELVYFRGYDYAKTARKLKPVVTREAVRQQHNKAIRKLRDAVIERGITIE